MKETENRMTTEKNLWHQKNSLRRSIKLINLWPDQGKKREDTNYQYKNSQETRNRREPHVEDHHI